MRVYRLARLLFAASPFDGEGSYRFGGRWSSPGTRVVYTAEHLSLENLSITACARPAGEALDNEGSLPTILFKRIFISHLHSYVIFNPNVLKPTEMASDSDVHGAKQ